MKNKRIVTYSKRLQLRKVNKKDDEDIFNEVLPADSSVTDLYAKTIESCKKSLLMGNKQHTERLTNDQQIDTQPTNENNNIDHYIRQPLIPRKSINSRSNHTPSKKTPATNVKKRTNIGKTPDLTCERTKIQRITPDSLNKLKSVKSSNKVEKWLEKTNGFCFETDPSLAVEVAPLVENKEVIEKDNEVVEQDDEIIAMDSGSPASDPSSISFMDQPIFTSPSNKEEITQSPIKTQQVIPETKKTTKRKKRRRICMPQPKRKKPSFVHHGIPKKVSKIHGKVLQLKLSPVKLKVKLKKDGELTFRKEPLSSRYNLRLKAKIAEMMINRKKLESNVGDEIVNTPTLAGENEPILKKVYDQSCQIIQKKNDSLGSGSKHVLSDENCQMEDENCQMEDENLLVSRKTGVLADESWQTLPNEYVIDSKSQSVLSEKNCQAFQKEDILGNRRKNVLTDCQILQMKNDLLGVGEKVVLLSGRDSEFLEKENEDVLVGGSKDELSDEHSEISDMSDLELLEARKNIDKLAEKEYEDNGDTPPMIIPMNENLASKRKLFTSKRTLNLQPTSSLSNETIADTSSDDTCCLEKEHSDFNAQQGECGDVRYTTMESGHSSISTDYLCARSSFDDSDIYDN